MSRAATKPVAKHAAGAETLMTTEEAGALLGVSAETVRRWMVEGCKHRGTGRLVRLRASRLGRQWKTSRSSLDAFVRALDNGGAS